MSSCEGGLNPNRDLLNVNFEGYKLSETPLAVIQKELPSAVATVTLKDEFSYQHLRAHSLHNHLHFDPLCPATVYWCSKSGEIMRALYDDKDTVSIQSVFHIDMPTKAIKRPSNVTMEFVGGNVGVVSAGDNEVIVFRRKIESETRREEWVRLKAFSLSDDNAVMIVAACLSLTGTKLHILCAELAKPTPPPASRDSAVGVATYKWVGIDLRVNPILSDLEPSDVGELTMLGTFESKSLALYAAFQHQSSTGKEELLLISETTPLLDASNTELKDEATPSSDNTMEQDGHLFLEAEHHCGLGYSSSKAYEWSQTESDVTVSFKLDSDVGKRDISCVMEPEELVVGLTDGTTLLRGELVHPVDPEASNWTIEGNILEVTLEKQVEGVVWKGLVRGASEEGKRERLPLEEGMESELSPEELEKARKMLAEMTGGTEDLSGSPSKKACRMVDPMLEECDTSDEDATLYVISEQCRFKQRIGFGGRQVVFTAPSRHDHPAYFALRHDVDAVVWLPHADSSSTSTRWCHASTFNALGYVQASKRERKFTSCSPNLSYAIISDSTRHVFIYMQPPGGGANSAAEHVYSAPTPTSILGLVATDQDLVFVLTEKTLTLLKIPREVNL